MYRFLMSWFLLCCSQMMIVAQEDKEMVKSGETSFRVSCFGEWEGEDLYVNLGREGQKKQKMKKLDLFDMGLSPIMKHTAGKPVQIYRQLVSDGEISYQTAYRIPIPQTVKKPLILFLPQGKKVFFKVFDLSAKNFPFGSCQVVNFSRGKFKIAMNKELRQLDSGKIQLFSPVKQEKERSWFRVMDLKSKTIVFSSMMTRRKSKRTIVFLVSKVDAQGRSVVIARTMEDYISEP